MRIDILPTTAPAVSDREGLKQGSDSDQGGATFFSVIDKMNAFAGQPTQAGTKSPAGKVEQPENDDHASEGAAVPLLPFAVADSESRQEPVASVPEKGLGAGDGQTWTVLPGAETSGRQSPAAPQAVVPAAALQDSPLPPTVVTASEGGLLTASGQPAALATGPLDGSASPASTPVQRPVGMATALSQAAQPDAPALTQPASAAFLPAAPGVASVGIPGAKMTSATPASPALESPQASAIQVPASDTRMVQIDPLPAVTSEVPAARPITVATPIADTEPLLNMPTFAAPAAPGSSDMRGRQALAGTASAPAGLVSPGGGSAGGAIGAGTAPIPEAASALRLAPSALASAPGTDAVFVRQAGWTAAAAPASPGTTGAQAEALTASVPGERVPPADVAQAGRAPEEASAHAEALESARAFDLSDLLMFARSAGSGKLNPQLSARTASTPDATAPPAVTATAGRPAAESTRPSGMTLAWSADVSLRLDISGLFATSAGKTLVSAEAAARPAVAGTPVDSAPVVAGSAAAAGALDPAPPRPGTASAPLSDQFASQSAPSGDTIPGLFAADEASAASADIPHPMAPAPVPDAVLAVDAPAQPAAQACVVSETNHAQNPAEAPAVPEPVPQSDVAPALPVTAGAEYEAMAQTATIGRDTRTSAVIDANAGRTSNGGELREGGKEGQSSIRRGQVCAPAEFSQPPQAPADSRRISPPAASEPELPAGSSQSEREDTNSSRLPSEAHTASAETSGNNAAQRPVSTVDSAESAWADMQNAQRALLLHNLPVRTGATEAASYGALRPTQQGTSGNSTSWTAGIQAPEPAAAGDLKALSALLAPKHAGPSQDPDFLTQLSERIQMQLREGENVIRVQLKPSTLGRLEIKAETSGAGFVATITTESSGVKEYLEHNLHLLQQSFQEQGLKIDRISVTVQEGTWQQHPSSGHQETRSGSGQQGESKSPAWQGGRLEGPSEELVLDPSTLAVLNPYSTFHTIA